MELKGREAPVPRAHGMGEAGAMKGVQLISHTCASQVLSVALKPVSQNLGLKIRYSNVHTLGCKSVPALPHVPLAALQSQFKVGWKYLLGVGLYC